MKPAVRRDHFRRYEFKRYQSKRFENPFFPKPTVKKSRYLSKAIIVIVCLTALSIGLANSDKLFIHHVIFNGLKNVSEQEAQDFVWNILHKKKLLIAPRTNFYFIGESDITKKLNSKFAFEESSTKREGDTLTIDVKERVSQIILSDGKKYYFVDLSGIVISEKTAEEAAASLLPIYFDDSGKTWATGDHALQADMINASLTFKKLTAEKGLQVSSFIIDESKTGLTAKMSDGYSVLFDTASEMEKQVGNLIVLLDESIEDPTKINYIDLRFGDHVYYK